MKPLFFSRISFQIQVTEARYTSVTQTLVKIGREEGLYGYFKVMFLPFVRL